MQTLSDSIQEQKAVLAQRAAPPVPDLDARQAAAEKHARWVEKCMALSEADLRKMAAESDCQYGERCGARGFCTFDLPPQHPCFGTAYPCSCRTAEINARRLEAMFEDAEVPAIYHGLGFDTFEQLPMDGKYDALSAARTFAKVDEFRYRRGLELKGMVKSGLMFYGPVGTGKSGLSVAILQAWKEAKQSVLWITWGHLVSRIQDTYGRDYDPRVRDDSLTRKKLLEAAQNIQLLILDDFGDVERRSTTDDRRDIAYSIIDYRHGRNLPTVITTNLAPCPNDAVADIENYWGPRIARRLRELCHLVGIGGVDIQRWADRRRESAA